MGWNPPPPSYNYGHKAIFRKIFHPSVSTWSLRGGVLVTVSELVARPLLLQMNDAGSISTGHVCITCLGVVNVMQKCAQTKSASTLPEMFIQGGWGSGWVP